MPKNESPILNEQFEKWDMIDANAIAKISPWNIHPDFRDALAAQLDWHLDDLKDPEVRKAITKWNQAYKWIIDQWVARSDVVEVSNMEPAANDSDSDDIWIDDDNQRLVA